MNDRDRLAQLAEGIADGSPVDWHAAESAVETPSGRSAVRRLKRILQVAQRHRGPVDVDRPGPWLSWGHLRLVERVGAGAFGEVYRAWDPKLDREVALKLLHRTEPPARVSEDIREGRLLARVRHPNVVSVYGADRIDGRIGIWMDFIHGQTLEEVLRSRGPFQAAEAASIGVDLCRALGAVHDAGLVHRDIKAQNVMRQDGGGLVLMDFGAGAEYGAAREFTVDELTGTPVYVAPEVFGGASATTRSDIYSLGVLLYHLVTGSYPVAARNLGELAEAHSRAERQHLRDARADLPDPFVHVVERALAANPADRFESAAAFEAALARVVRTPKRIG